MGTKPNHLRHVEEHPPRKPPNVTSDHERKLRIAKRTCVVTWSYDGSWGATFLSS